MFEPSPRLKALYSMRDVARKGWWSIRCGEEPNIEMKMTLYEKFGDYETEMPTLLKEIIRLIQNEENELNGTQS